MIFLYLLLAFGISFAPAQSLSPRVLIYSATAEFRHDSIPVAIQTLKENGAAIHTTFHSTEDKTDFNDINLSQYDAIVFLSNTGQVLDASGMNALQNYLNSGGNFVGIHSASDSHRNTTFFVREIGAKFDFHAQLQEATMDVIGPPHPSTDKLPRKWTLRDEMYNFQSDPRRLGAVVVLSADESSYTDTSTRKFDQGEPHPLAWYQEHGAGVSDAVFSGRSFYTSLGHSDETWQNPVFLSHVLGGICWVLQSNLTRAYNASGLVGNAEPGAGNENSGVSESVSVPASFAGTGRGYPQALLITALFLNTVFGI